MTLFFVKISELHIKKASYFVNCNQIKYIGAVRDDKGKIIYHAQLLDDEPNSYYLHQIRKSDYERLKKL